MTTGKESEPYILKAPGHSQASSFKKKASENIETSGYMMKKKASQGSISLGPAIYLGAAASVVQGSWLHFKLVAKLGIVHMHNIRAKESQSCSNTLERHQGQTMGQIMDTDS